MHRRSVLALAVTSAFVAVPLHAQEDDADLALTAPVSQATALAAPSSIESLIDDAGAAQPTGAITPAVQPAPVLRPSIEASTLRTVARPVPASQSAKLPLTPASPLPDREGDARSEYEPLGLRLGSFVVNGSLSSGIGYLRNTQDGNEVFLRSSAAISAKSDWDSNSLQLDLGGALRQSISGIDEQLPEGNARLSGSFDLTNADRLSAAAGWTLRDDDGKVNTFSGTLGYERVGGLVGLKSSLGVDRTLKEADPSEDNVALSTSLRLSLDSGAMLQPFVEVGAFTRRFDTVAAGDGLSRNGSGGEAKLGVAVSRDDLSGEIALGYGYEWLDEAALKDISGIVGSASVDWKATELMDVSALLSTSFEPTSTSGASGVLKHTGDIGVTYALAPNAFVTTGAQLAYENYSGIDRDVLTTTLKAGVGYRFNRSVEVGLDGEHKIVHSSEAGGSYDESTVTATLTLKR